MAAQYDKSYFFLSGNDIIHYRFLQVYCAADCNDLARPPLERILMSSVIARKNPKIGMVSLGCPKALVDSERILTKLRSDGYEMSPDYDGADVVIVNTCGFLDSAKAESLEAIGEAIRENGKVIVTGCLGVEADRIRAEHPAVLAITGPQQYEEVVNAVHDTAPPPHHPFVDLVPEQGLKLTPRHYSYLKISEGCNHSCSFCIIPDLRGKLVSRPAGAVLREAEKLVAAGTKELLVISQDTSAYGVDIKHAASPWRDQAVRAHMTDLCAAMSDLGVWIRLHYVYPYPHVDQVIPLMAEGKILPYLDIPFQHASPSVLKSMRRPAHQEKILHRIADWRRQIPGMAVRSTFIVGYPGETEEDFQFLLDWLQEAQLDRVGCFQYENVEGAAARDLPDHVPAEVKQERHDRFMATQQAISEARLQARIGTITDVIIDEVVEEGAVGRTKADAPDIDGQIFLDDATHLKVGDIIRAKIIDADEYDLWGEVV